MRKATSIKVDIEVWKQAKKRAIDLNMHISEYLESLIKRDMEEVK